MIRVITLVLISVTISACSHDYIKTDLSIQAARYLNPNIQHRPAPIVVTIFMLKDAHRFQQADYNALATHGDITLGANLLDQRQLIVRPNQTRQLQLHANRNTRYLGVVAGYRNLNHARWRRTLKLPHDQDSIKLSLFLGTLGLQATLNE